MKCDLLTDTQGWLRICAAVYRASAFTCSIRLINSFMEKGKKESLQGVGKDIKIENAVAPSSSQSS